MSDTDFWENRAAERLEGWLASHRWILNLLIAIACAAWLIDGLTSDSPVASTVFGVLAGVYLVWLIWRLIKDGT